MGSATGFGSRILSISTGVQIQERSGNRVDLVGLSGERLEVIWRKIKKRRIEGLVIMMRNKREGAKLRVGIEEGWNNVTP